MIVQSRIRQINADRGWLKCERSMDWEFAALVSAVAWPQLVFFISDGFIVDDRKSNAADVLREVVKEAARVGAVVYTMDTAQISQIPRSMLPETTSWISLRDRVAGYCRE